jgi:hypothetical protein
MPVQRRLFIAKSKLHGGSFMETRARKAIHITWIEAQRAEAERDKVRQARYHPRPAPDIQRI